MRICVLTRDKDFFALLRAECLFFPCSVILAEGEPYPLADLYLCDLSAFERPMGADSIGFGENGGLSRDYDAEKLEKLLEERIYRTPSQRPLVLSQRARCALWQGEEIRFSEREFALLSFFFENERRFFTREELALAIWGEGADAGIVPVYIHYLRVKLEKGGIKMIKNNRENGYAFAKEGWNADADLR